MYQATSGMAYASVQSFLSSNQLTVLRAIKHLELATNKQIARYLKWEINSVTPRVNELTNQYNLVRESKKDRCPVSGRTSIFWTLKEINIIKI